MPEVRLIDANALAGNFGKWLDELKGECTRGQTTEIENTLGTIEAIECCIAEIESAPTIEPEVRHGHWENIPGMNNTVFCSECLAAANKELAMKYKGCPFCLARMDGGADNGNEFESYTGDICECETVTHWMPLPNPPEAGADDA